MRPWARDLVVRKVKAAYFVQAEKAGEVNKILKEFFEM